ncbi:pyridoxamine 5'-phosphate oxidase family protein [Halobacillus locisalis]|uniref:Pyridoxamine 5'-phosphate oxidase family protein n=1 Tax=Halobacillus locisalis TaxID=220753 RepID=A0A838CXR9_9BACI|nr:pyridoxamine 5'-phosphate oxidase family protein [Halobacillus locisalis]MBA2176724.1 pyridoxamine 5'-phosphate oxidase family protein [Halobacillus locisalis]
MNQEELKAKIHEVMENHKVGTLATVKDGKPHTRYMTFSNNDAFTFFTPTNRETHKAEEIEENPNVHILLGYEGEGYGDGYLEIEGQAKIRDDQDIKDWLWNDRMKRWFDSKDDPEYIVLEIMPEAIRLMNEGEDTPEILEL